MKYVITSLIVFLLIACTKSDSWKTCWHCTFGSTTKRTNSTA